MSGAVLSLFAVRPHRIGGTEVYARELAEQLARRGWSSVVGFMEAPPPAVREFLSLPNVAIEVFDAGRNLTRDLTRLIRAHRPQILHLHYLGFVSPCPWVARVLGVRQIYFTDQASPPEGFTPAAAPWWKRIAVRTVNAPVNAVISVSEYGRSVLAARQVMPERRLRLIYNSVDVERAACGATRRQEFRERYGIPETALVFAQVGQLIREKGLHDLLQAAVIVMAAEPRAHLVLAGGGAQREELAKTAERLGIPGRVTFTGVVPDPLAEGLYAAADVLCQMSRWEEVFGYVIAEAMASGKPVVGTRAGGIPELIAHGTTGFLVKRGGIDEMAERILELLRDAGLRGRMGQAGRDAALKKFDHKKNVARLMDFYFPA